MHPSYIENTVTEREACQHDPGLGDRAWHKLTDMDRSEELCLVTAALCAFGSVFVSQLRHS